MIAGKTASGFDYEIKNKKVHDWNFRKKLSEFKKDPDDMEKYEALIIELIGAEYTEKLFAYATDDEGCIDSDFIDETVKQIINDNINVKNS